MIIELGHYCLALVLTISLFQFLVPAIGVRYNSITLMKSSYISSYVTFILVSLSFLALTYAYISSDFSVSLVANNSHSLKPLIYKISGVWGNHEGSLLLWVLILTFYSAAVALLGKRLPLKLISLVLSCQGLIASAFVSFILFTSNPFTRLFFPKIEGEGFNPILQDFGLAIHPPFLYLGYVGLSVTFSFSVAALLLGKVDTIWVKWVRPWTLIAWVFLTVGIALGSWWAYRELGWGGWWFWDPVENASLLPWLLNLALIHSILILERRSSLLNWTILLCIMGFSFSMIGTFIVRSGLITSVHAFANDPSRGLFILLIIFVAIATSLSIYITKRPNTVSLMKLNFASKELWILVQNLTLLVITAIVFLGTIWPFIIEALFNEQVSVGEPFYEISLLPFVVIFAFMLPIASKVAWRGKNFVDIKKLLSLILICSGVSASGFLFGTLGPLTFIGFFLASWVCLSSILELIPLFQFYFPISKFANRTPLVNFRLIGRTCAHFGFGLPIFGVTAVSSWETEDIRNVEIGENFYKREKILLFSKSFKSDSPIKKVLIEVLFFISSNSSLVLRPLSEIRGEE